MKKLSFIAASLVALFAGNICAEAQKYEPRSTWPYLFETFTEAQLVSTKGTALAACEVNVNIVNGALHYLEKGKIMAADMSSVAEATVGDSKFVNAYGKMMEEVAGNGNGSVLKATSVDVDKMAKTDIGYGISSATASSQNLNSLLGEGSSDMVNTEITNARAKMGEGVPVPVMERLYLKIGTIVVPATKKDISLLPCVDKADFAAFLKTAKVKWSNPESLVSVVEFIYEQSNK